eukprot:sb/3476100/
MIGCYIVQLIVPQLGACYMSQALIQLTLNCYGEGFTFNNPSRIACHALIDPIVTHLEWSNSQPDTPVNHPSPGIWYNYRSIVDEGDGGRGSSRGLLTGDIYSTTFFHFPIWFLSGKFIYV